MLRKTRKVNYEIDMKDKKKRRKIFHVNMLKKWHPPDAKSFWTSEEVESAPEEEESIPTWKGEYGAVPIISTQLTEQQREQLLNMLIEFKSIMSGKVRRTLSCQHRIHLKETIPV